MTLTHLTDFSDRLSPMLVKELRQGLRAKTFIAVFLSLQIFLAVMMFSATAAAPADFVGNIVSGIIFSFFAVAVLLVQPLRGISALSSEAKGNTLDMMALTRLSSWKIVIGKWIAIVSQTALLLSTIIPYLILRYFFGGMNLVGELMVLVLMFLTSMALTAITVGLSGCSSVIVRSLVPIFGLPMLLWMLLMSVRFGSMGGAGGDFFSFLTLTTPASQIGVGSYVVGLIYLTLSLLSLGASLIAPAAENHCVWRRVSAFWGLIIVIPMIATDTLGEGWHALVTFVIVVPAILTALSESAPLVATVSEPFEKRGVLGKAVGAFLYPTWPSGILFSVVLGVLAVIALMIHPSFNDRNTATVMLSILGSLFFPAAWQAIFFRGDGQRLANYLLILVGSGVMLLILMVLTDAMNSADFLWFFAWNPLAFIAMAEGSHAGGNLSWEGVIMIDTVLGVLLLVHATSLLLRKPTSSVSGS